ASLFPNSPHESTTPVSIPTLDRLDDHPPGGHHDHGPTNGGPSLPMRSSLRTASAAVPLPFPAGEQVVAQICATVHRRRLHSLHTPLAIDCPRASPFSASYSRPLERELGLHLVPK